jgi:hypothetical protein
MPSAPQMKRRDSNDLTHMFITTYRLMTAFKRSLLGIRSGTVAETKNFILSHSSTAVASLGLLYEVPLPLWDTPHSVTLPWTSDRPVARWNEILTTQLIPLNYLQYGQFPVATKGCPWNKPFGPRTGTSQKPNMISGRSRARVPLSLNSRILHVKFLILQSPDDPPVCYA